MHLLGELSLERGLAHFELRHPRERPFLRLDIAAQVRAARVHGLADLLAQSLPDLDRVVAL